ncbi:hypothetical protein SteCoe_29813 [Stentor coeruleus]|uniref:Orn/DAP/Arg decarboxylase 2 N-terminal domain-containing protein n=1 Tax=Stentor coeruleus TaxID=5963 RepID=A0A1R2B513_9CILI|nr:hypothetical protein SteCoe_29813 [Stentor coeruleus]
MNVIGVSFHVGSGCKSPNAFYYAIKNCKQLFDFAKCELGFNFTLLDIGGGFSDLEKEISSGSSLFERIARTIKEALDEFFPDVIDNKKLRIIAEPGRVFTLAVSVSSKKLLSNNRQVLSSNDKNLQVEKIMYYVNEGLYTAFICVVFDHKVCKPSAVFINDKLQILDDSFEHVFKSVIWGPTCDGIDCVSRELEMPQLEVGDWMIFDNFGAYTMAASTNFNGFSSTKIHWVN